MSLTSTLPALVNQDMVVFSHLRWEFVKQRPQHLLERIARHNRVLFVEEPIVSSVATYGTANIIDIDDNLRVIQPRITWGSFADLSKVVQRYSHLETTTPLVWLYSASYLPVLDYLKYQLLIYDCMDELSAFKGAPAELRRQEEELLNQADLVFTGGKSLYEAKQPFNPQTYCFPSSVDQKHFARAYRPSTVVPADLRAIRQPRIGFYGVIDERLDLTLLAAVAAQNPELAFVLIGPVVKIDPAELPQAANIYYLGSRSYDQLPAYLKGFTVAMMPFALNEATRFISPTKTLEFMAAGKPIVSTPITDVKRSYHREVKIAATAAEFSHAIRGYLSESTWSRQLRLARQAAVIQGTSWDNTAQQMMSLMATQLAALDPQPVVATVQSPALGVRVQVAI